MTVSKPINGGQTLYLEFRARNGFGVTNLESASAAVDVKSCIIKHWQMS
jgi:hypothetical protein